MFFWRKWKNISLRHFEFCPLYKAKICWWIWILRSQHAAQASPHTPLPLLPHPTSHCTKQNRILSYTLYHSICTFLLHNPSLYLSISFLFLLLLLYIFLAQSLSLSCSAFIISLSISICHLFLWFLLDLYLFSLSISISIYLPLSCSCSIVFYLNLYTSPLYLAHSLDLSISISFSGSFLCQPIYCLFLLRPFLLALQKIFFIPKTPFCLSRVFWFFFFFFLILFWHFFTTILNLLFYNKFSKFFVSLLCLFA